MDRSNNAPIKRPKRLLARPDMAYESLDSLYYNFDMDTFGEHFGLIVSCSRPSIFESNGVRGLLHKLEILALPDLASAKISVTHEVQPALDSCAQIIPVHDRLKVAGFDSGCIIPITNFGQGRNFHSDVRSRLSHHSGQITCLAANSAGTRLASGCTAGEITLYQASGEEILFTSRTGETYAPFITAMSFIRPLPRRIPSGAAAGASNQQRRTYDQDSGQDENLLIYTTNNGRVCLLDARCNLADDVHGQIWFNTEPRVSLTSLLSVRSKPGHLIYLGGSCGELMACDLRKPGEYLGECQRNKGDGSIRGMKEVLVQDGLNEKAFIAFSNSTRDIQILDLDNLQPHEGWTCDRRPEGKVRDLIQVGDRIITCGDLCSIGGWKWDTTDCDKVNP